MARRQGWKCYSCKWTASMASNHKGQRSWKRKEKTFLLMLEKIESRRRRGWQRMRWHHWLDGHEFEQAPGDGDGQERLVCCSPRDRKDSDTTEWLNWLTRGHRVRQDWVTKQVDKVRKESSLHLWECVAPLTLRSRTSLLQSCETRKFCSDLVTEAWGVDAYDPVEAFHPHPYLYSHNLHFTCSRPWPQETLISQAEKRKESSWPYFLQDFRTERTLDAAKWVGSWASQCCA